MIKGDSMLQNPPQPIAKGGDMGRERILEKAVAFTGAFTQELCPIASC